MGKPTGFLEHDRIAGVHEKAGGQVHRLLRLLRVLPLHGDEPCDRRGATENRHPAEFGLVEHVQPRVQGVKEQRRVDVAGVIGAVDRRSSARDPLGAADAGLSRTDQSVSVVHRKPGV